MATRVADVLLPTTMVGSYPRPRWFTHQLGGRDVLDTFKSVEHHEAYVDATRAVIDDQEQAGLDVVTDGQMWFDDLHMGIGSFFWYWFERIPGFGPEMVLHRNRDRASGRDVFVMDEAGAAVLRGAVGPGPLRLAYLFQTAQAAAARPVKASVGAGPCQLAGLVHFESGPIHDRFELSAALAEVFNAELLELQGAGCVYVQYEDLGAWTPNLTGERDFAWVTETVNHVLAGVTVRKAWHFCLGNAWGNRLDALVRGGYGAVVPHYLDVDVDELTLDFACREMADAAVLKEIPSDIDVGVGVIDVRNLEIEQPEQVAERIRTVLGFIEPERVTLTTDCGMKQLPRPVAAAKLRSLVAGAAIVRDELEGQIMTDTGTDFSASMTARITTFDGKTPLQVLAERGEVRPTPLTSLERFPYYTAFPYAWYFAAYSEDLPVGDVQTARWLARDLVIWRGDDGEAHVMDAYCPHMGAHLGYGGRVEGCNLVCPYHWWEYDGDGRNVRIPYADAPNRKARVRSYPTVDRNGLIMLFWYHPLGVEPMWELPELPEVSDPDWIDELRVEWDVRCPWQEMAENGPDYVHLRTVHGAAEVPEVESLTYEGPSSTLRSKVSFSTPRGPQAGRIDTDSWGPGFAIARFSGITPAIFVSLTTPIDWELTRSIKLYRVKQLGEGDEARARTRRVGEALVRDLRKQMEEDIVIFDHKVWVDPPALAPDDGPIVRFRKWASQFYVAGDPVAAGREKAL